MDKTNGDATKTNIQELTDAENQQAMSQVVVDNNNYPAIQEYIRANCGRNPNTALQYKRRGKNFEKSF
jgi:hypothetical protein